MRNSGEIPAGERVVTTISPTLEMAALDELGPQCRHAIQNARARFSAADMLAQARRQGLDPQDPFVDAEMAGAVTSKDLAS